VLSSYDRVFRENVSQVSDGLLFGLGCSRSISARSSRRVIRSLGGAGSAADRAGPLCDGWFDYVRAMTAGRSTSRSICGGQSSQVRHARGRSPLCTCGERLPVHLIRRAAKRTTKDNRSSCSRDASAHARGEMRRGVGERITDRWRASGSPRRRSQRVRASAKTTIAQLTRAGQPDQREM